MREQSAPERIGPYRLDREISRGGSGVVFVAVHVKTGREVALKTLIHLRAEDQQSLRREIFTLGRVDHPGIVRLFESGVHEGVPWYAMEHIRQPTLAQLWEAGELTPEVSLLVLARLCRTLAFLHAEGIVHRDLKPSNVMVRASLEPVLVDFGFVSRFSVGGAREPLEVGGEFVGTIAYMSPEQISGEYVDARSDLYSLGCMLYEAVAGRQPFVGSPTETIRQHLGRRPDRPLSADDRLWHLIQEMLEKEPRRRRGYATDVARDLAALVPSGDAPVPQPLRPYLYRATFAGRGDVLDGIGEVLEQAERGNGRLLLVLGESGSGKTRFAMEATRYATAREFRVITGECAPVQAGGAEVRGAPFHAFRSLLRAVADQCLQDGAAATARLLGGRAVTLSAFEPALSMVPDFDRQPQPVRLTGEPARARAISDLLDVIREFARERPLLLVVDDLQWADDLTLGALAALRVQAKELSLVAIGTARSEEAARDVLELDDQPLYLGKLGRQAIQGIVCDMLAMLDPPTEFVDVLLRESAGNPFFVSEYLRAAVDSDFLKRSDGRWQTPTLPTPGPGEVVSFDIPATLHGLLERRLARLPSDCRDLLEAGAVLGREFKVSMLAALDDLSDGGRLEALSILVQREVFEESAGTLRFTHDQLRELSYGKISSEELKALHARAASHIEAAYAGQAELPAWYPQLANHWSVAGVSERAVKYFDLAGAHALDAGAHGEAFRSLSKALEISDGREAPQSGTEVRTARRRRMLSVASFGMGDLRTSVEHAERALGELSQPVVGRGARAGGVVVLGIARRAILPASRVADVDATWEALFEGALTSGQLATLWFFSGDSLRTLAYLVRGLDSAERSGANEAVVEACARLGYVAGTARLSRLAVHFFRRAEATAARADDTRGRALSRYLEAQYWLGLGQWDRVLALGEEAARQYEGVGDAHEAETACTIAAHGHFYSGDVEAADMLLNRVLSTASARSNAQHTGWGMFLSGRSCLHRGEAETALALCAEARVLIERLPDSLSNVMLDGTHALAALHCGRMGEAVDSCSRVVKRLTRGERQGVPQCVDGLAGAADVVLSLRERGETGLDSSLKVVLRGLRRFATLFPLARPAHYRSRARMAWMEGRLPRARREWQRSKVLARRLGMPFDEARVELDMARVSGSPAEHLAAAAALLQPMGCVGLIDRELGRTVRTLGG